MPAARDHSHAPVIPITIAAAQPPGAHMMMIRKPQPWRTPASIACLLVCLIAAAARAEDPKAWVAKNIDDLQGLYRHLHTHPELSFQEEQTGARLADELRKLGIEVTVNVGRRGVVGVLKNGAGPTVMIRTDLDALPVTEATGL